MISHRRGPRGHTYDDWCDRMAAANDMARQQTGIDFGAVLFVAAIALACILGGAF